MKNNLEIPDGWRILEDDTLLEVGDAVFYNIIVPHLKKVIAITPLGTHARLENSCRVRRVGAIGKTVSKTENIYRLRKI